MTARTPYDPTPFGPTALDDPAEWAEEWESYMAANAAAAGQYRAMPTSFNRPGTGQRAAWREDREVEG